MIAARASYFYGFNPRENDSVGITVGAGVQPVALMDEPEVSDFHTYCKRLLETLVDGTRLQNQIIPVIANIEYPWPRFDKPLDRAEVHRIAIGIGSVLEDWRKTCGFRRGGYGAYGLHIADRWGNPDIKARNEIVAGWCKKPLDRIDIDGYCWQNTEKEPHDLLTINGDPVAFLDYTLRADAAKAKELWGKPVHAWISHEEQGKVARNLPLETFQKVVTGCVGPMVRNKVLGGCVHFGGFGKPALPRKKPALKGPDFQPAEFDYVQAYVDGTRSLRTSHN